MRTNYGLGCSYWGRIAIAYLLMSAPIHGQIIPDDSLGNEQSTVREGVVNQLPSALIEGGAARQNNLFHSFEQFDVESGRGAYFVDPGVRNIIGRVTGGDRSEIFGRLGVLGGDANLFLMNPEGFLFGPNATLDLNGSFVATSADEMQFGNVGSFRTLQPNVPSDTLTIDPSAFLVNQLNPGRITSQSILRDADGLIQGGLIVPNDRSLVLLGGEVLLEDTYLQASEGRVEIAGLIGPGQVNFRMTNNTNQIKLTRFPNSDLADITLQNRAVIDVTGANRGDIALTGRNIELTELSTIRAGLSTPLASTTTPLFSENGEAGNILIRATEEFTLRQGSEILNRVDLDAVGNSTNIFLAVNRALAAEGDPLDELFGSVFIFADSINILGGTADFPGRISTSTLGDGNAGLVFLSANDSILIRGIPPRRGDGLISLIASSVGSNATGSAGGIFMQTNALRMTDGALMSTSTFGNGNPGLVLILADNPETAIENDGSIELLDGSSIFSNIESGGNSSGEGRGVISLATSTLELHHGAQLQTLIRQGDAGSAAGIGNAGRISITALDSVVIVGVNPVSTRASSIFSTVGEGARGEAGEVEILTGRLELREGGSIETSTFGRGDAGDINVTANDILIDGIVRIPNPIPDHPDEVIVRVSSIESFAGANARGNGGEIILRATDSVILDNDAEITTSTFSDNSRAGGVGIRAERIELRNDSNIFSNVESGADNAIGGAIVLIAEDDLSLFGGSQIQTIVRGSTRDNLDTSKDESSPAGNGDAGDILLTADSMQIDGFVLDATGQRFSSAVFSSVGEGADGNGGNIFIVLEDDLALTNGGLIDVTNRSLFSEDNEAGNIFLTVPRIFVLNNGFISAQTRTGDGGNLGEEESPWEGGEFLILANGSQISTSAGTDNRPGDGGNINLNAGAAILGLPSRDTNITASAFDGSGGNININGTVNFLDIAPRSEDFSNSNDITADSEYGDDGQITTNGLDFDPSRGIIELPADLIEPTVAQVCPLPGGLAASELSEFYITGRGGLPTAPDDPGSAAAIASDWVEVPEAGGEVGSEGEGEAIAFDPSLITPAAVPVEFQSWQIDDNGDVLLLASTATPVAPPVGPQCQPAEE